MLGGGEGLQQSLRGYGISPTAWAQSVESMHAWKPQRSWEVCILITRYFPIVLMMVVNAHYHFICIDVGGLESNNDGGVFFNSLFWKAMRKGRLSITESGSLATDPELGKLPHIFLGDKAFPIMPNLLRPYTMGNKKSLGYEQHIFNYRLLYQAHCRERLQVVGKKMVSVQQTIGNGCVLATCVLQNLIQSMSTPLDNMVALEEIWPGFCGLHHIGCRPTSNAMHIREKFH